MLAGMKKEQFMKVARRLLGAGAAVLLAKGIVDESTAEQLVGALATTLAIGWEIFTRKR